MSSVHWRKKNSPALLHQDPRAFFHRWINAQRACTHTRICQVGACQQWDLREKQHQIDLFQCHYSSDVPPRVPQHSLFLPVSSFSKWELGSLFNHNYFLFLDHFREGFTVKEHFSRLVIITAVSCALNSVQSAMLWHTMLIAVVS